MKRLPHYFLECLGDPERQITGVTAPDTGTPDTAVFLATPKALRHGLASHAGVIVIGKKSRAQAEDLGPDRSALIANNVEMAMAAVISEFFLRSPYLNPSVSGVHPTAMVDKNARLGARVRIGPGAFIAAGVRIGDDVYVGANTVVETDSEIGDGTVLHPLVFIGHSTVIGKRCEIQPQTTIGKEGFGYVNDEKFNHYRIPHAGRVVLEDDVHIGSCCTVDRGTFGETRVEFGTKTDNHVHIAHNCRVGRNSLLTAAFLIGGSARVGANFVAGGQTVVTGHIEVCDNVQVSARSGISKTLTQPGHYGGLPLLPIQQHIKMKAAQAYLPEMRKQLRLVMRKLGMDLRESESEAES